MTSKEIVISALEFKRFDRVPNEIDDSYVGYRSFSKNAVPKGHRKPFYGSGIWR